MTKRATIRTAAMLGGGGLGGLVFTLLGWPPLLGGAAVGPICLLFAAVATPDRKVRVRCIECKTVVVEAYAWGDCNDAVIVHAHARSCRKRGVRGIGSPSNENAEADR